MSTHERQGGIPRRGLLKGLAGGAAALACPQTRAEAPVAGDRQPFYGALQAGVVTPQPAAALVVAFDVLADSRAELERLFRTLTARIAFLNGEALEEYIKPVGGGYFFVLPGVRSPDDYLGQSLLAASA